MVVKVKEIHQHQVEMEILVQVAVEEVESATKFQVLMVQLEVLQTQVVEEEEVLQQPIQEEIIQVVQV